MNKLLLAVLLLLSGLSVQAQASPAWPHNPKTGEVEMQGMLPWPDSAKTELQRRRLVQHWCLTKLAALLAHKPQQLSITKEPSYGGVPLWVYLSRYQADPPLAHGIGVACQAELMPTPKGLGYHFSDFNFMWWDYDVSSSDSLDRIVFKDKEPIAVKGREILATARKRLAALSSW
jgi:hypothetical protein